MLHYVFEYFVPSIVVEFEVTKMLGIYRANLFEDLTFPYWKTSSPLQENLLPPSVTDDAPCQSNHLDLLNKRKKISAVDPHLSENRGDTEYSVAPLGSWKRSTWRRSRTCSTQMCASFIIQIYPIRHYRSQSASFSLPVRASQAPNGFFSPPLSPPNNCRNYH